MTTPLLQIENLHAEIDGTPILRGITLTVEEGNVQVLMGRNGSGKSTLAYTLLGHPAYTVTAGTIYFKGEDVTALPPNERAQRGMFLSFQYPVTIPGVTVTNFLRESMKAITGKDTPIREFRQNLEDNLAKLEVPRQFISRYVNDGFSGGEKKRFEILTLAMLKPALAILDETDSGLDVDALRIISKGITDVNHETKMGILLITHYQRILDYIKPDIIHIVADGRIVASGDHTLAQKLEKHGYDSVI